MTTASCTRQEPDDSDKLGIGATVAIMWLCTSSSFLSVVASRDTPSLLLVRARVKGHIERVFPTAKTFTDVDADYRYRAFIDRTEVAKVIADRLLAIDYDNFKDSVEDDQLHDAYLKVWSAMHKLQT